MGQADELVPNIHRLASLRMGELEHMQSGEEPNLDDTICEIASLLAAAYARHLKILLIRDSLEPIASGE